MILLTRGNFRETCLKRDGYQCAICGSKNDLVVHHIIERRLFENGGYFENNGISICPSCHIKCEQTLISVEEARKAAGIIDKCIPNLFYADEVIDKFGNVILPNGMRMRGPLFDDASVYKILEPVHHLFTKYVKYPRTWHMFDSPGVRSDDRVLDNDNQFHGKEVVVSLKKDGECTNMYNDFIHARSISNNSHVSRHWVKNFHSKIAHDIPLNWRICGENLWAKHSIFYDNLETYLYGFSIWNENNQCLNWDETLEWFSLLGIIPVHVFYRGEYHHDKISSLFLNNYSTEKEEGYVIRLAGSFHYRDFYKSVAKWVRKSHVTNNEHWFFGKAIEKNLLKK